jgi:hypothetical protein
MASATALVFPYSQPRRWMMRSILVPLENRIRLVTGESFVG